LRSPDTRTRARSDEGDHDVVRIGQERTPGVLGNQNGAAADQDMNKDG
jgi:hypothetical protein